MKTKYDVGDCVTVSGTIVRTEILPEDRVLYYMDEAPGVPILEKDIRKESMEKIVKYISVTINGLDDVKRKCIELSEKIEEVEELVDSMTSIELTVTAGEPED